MGTAEDADSGELGQEDFRALCVPAVMLLYAKQRQNRLTFFGAGGAQYPRSRASLAGSSPKPGKFPAFPSVL